MTMATPTTDHSVYATPLKADVRAHLKTLCETHSTQTLLEIGTGLGESSAWLLRALASLNIDTVEKNGDAADAAFQRFKALHLLDRVNLYHEDAHHFYPVRVYDAILIDASKSQQKALVERFFKHLDNRGFMLIDNIALSRINDAPQTASREALKTKHDTFLNWLKNDPRWTVEFCDLGDGIAVLTPIIKPKS